MTHHALHLAIGQLVDASRLPNWDVLKDSACDQTHKQRITLFRKAESKSIRFCDVDLLIAVDGKARVIIEIEESNVKPVQVFGKFFASAFSTHYKPKAGAEYQSLGNPVLFIQIVDSSTLKLGKTKKVSQWGCIEGVIQSQLANWSGRATRYELVEGRIDEFRPDSEKGQGLAKLIQGFLEDVQRG